MSPVVLHVEDAGAGADGATYEPADVALALEAAMARLDVAPEAEVSLVLTGDATLQDLNRAHRHVDEPTDVLSFAADPADWTPGEPPYLGDILISVPQAAAGGRATGHPLADELRLLAVHGLLHLLGHDDETDAGAAEMERLEVELGVRRADDVGE